ncbi:ProQ/FINO family protein [Rhizobium sp. P32RR-XVIII]|uniref:ProQ/FINO family protein n=1 Tax=Rhizobium sp. P32RR-XVIII TaxID=2726738 RepID=UPI0014572F4F|nr:ProQ/FINO family protein [Rhizobium sp. P32RR-XVIII]NLS07153.1 ProQ/FINO family protein [Rhizobium sp. P32RR-XVIII]
MDEAWTVSRGPIAATDFDVRKAEAINAMLVRPAGVLPMKAGEPIRPFALGLFNELRALLKPGYGVTSLRRATAFYVYSKRYYFASAQPDSMRHDIDGRAVEPLSPADRLAAQRSFFKLKQNYADDMEGAATPDGQSD